MTETVLITGSSGVIGRCLVAEERRRGNRVVGADRVPPPDGFASPDVFHRIDLDCDDVGDLLSSSPSVVYHLAASFERSEESAEYWDIGWRDDVVVSHRLLSAVRASTSVETVVFASSYLVYDPSLYLLDRPGGEVRLDEKDRVLPRNLCGATKFYTERELAFVWATMPRLRIVMPRIYRVFGRGSRDVISRWIRDGISERSIEVFNERNRFDYVLADDVAAALADLGWNPDAHGPVNVGTGVATQIADVVRTIEQALGSTFESTNTGDTAPYEASVADTSRLAEVARVPSTSLLDGIALVAEFERRRADD